MLDSYVIVRAASIYIAVMLTGAVWMWRRPTTRSLTGALLAAVWNLPVVLVLHLAADRFLWWRFDASGGLFLGMPVELYLTWVWVWGAVLALAFPTLRLDGVLLVALAADLVLMPLATPVVRLGPSWIVGEIAGLLLGVLPAQLLARWTSKDECLAGRAVLQVIAFSGLVLVVVPAIAIEGSGSEWLNPFVRPAWQISLLAQALCLPAIVGLTAVQEFVERGRGTPVPFDPPRRLVTTGIYAYVGNPMQLATVVLLAALGLILRSVWVSAAGVMAHVYSVGLAGWDEDEDLGRRFGESWVDYRRGVRRWIPRLRPWANRPPARLFVSESCGMCRDVGRWFERRGARRLVIVAAERHPSCTLTRITYEPDDGTRAATGVEAVGRALEHVHIGWALLGCWLRLPVARQLAQLLIDASGGHPRRVARTV